MVAFAKAVKAQGHQIILWTSRAGADLENAVEWCRLQGIVFDAVNEPLPEQIKRWGNDTRKIYADYYIDDKNMTIAQVESTMNQIKEIMEEMAVQKAREHNMGQFKDYMDLDEHPFTGLRKLSMPFKARIKNTEYIRKFFDGTPNFSQVEDVTIGKVYEIHAVNGYGDVSDFIFTDDLGNENRLGSFFFEDAESEDK